MSPALVIALRLRGYARPEALAAMLGTDVTPDIAALLAAGLASETKLGLRLTPAGQAAAEAAWAAERAALDAAAMAALYERFHAPNARFKAIIADWQMRGGQPNDHQDKAHDDAVLARLAAVHAELQPILAAAGAQAPRLARYQARLDAALAAIGRGEHRFVAAPLIDSYHTIWFELHEELIRLAGLTRAGEAKAGRA